MSSWKPLAGRVTFLSAFNMLTSAPSSLDVFQSLWKTTPDNFRKSANPLLPSVAQGKNGEIQINCSIAAGRADINFSPVIPSMDQDAAPTLRFIESPDQLHVCFEDVIEGVKSGALHLNAGRVAIEVHFVCLENDIPSANQSLVQTIPRPYQLNLSDEEDVIFQVNRFFVTKNGNRLNAVCNWSLVRFQLLNFSIAATLGQPVDVPSSVFQTDVSLLGASLKLEVNNAILQSSPVLERADQAVILSEGLAKITTTQQEYGLNVSGFQHVE